MPKLRLYLVLLAFLGAFAAQGQTRQASGQALNAADKTPLPGVSVLLKGTSTGSAAAAGTFELAVPPAPFLWERGAFNKSSSTVLIGVDWLPSSKGEGPGVR